jgi:serine/threonine-protein kinase SRPK3
MHSVADRDARLQQNVAMKVVDAESSRDNQELPILQLLSRTNLPHKGQSCVITLLDSFTHSGPNGCHLCLVLPLMPSDLSQLTLRGYPRSTNYIRALSSQLLLGLDFIHSSGIVHCGQ